MKNYYKISILIGICVSIALFQNCSGSSSGNTVQQSPETPPPSFISQYSEREITSILPNYYKGSSKIVGVDPLGNGFLVQTSMIETKKFIEVITQPLLKFREIPDSGIPIESVHYSPDGMRILLLQPSNGLKRILILNSADLSINSSVNNVVNLEYVSKTNNNLIYLYGERISTHYYSPETYKYKIYNIDTAISSEFYVAPIPGCYNCAPPQISSFYLYEKFIYYSINKTIFKFNIDTSELTSFPNFVATGSGDIKFISTDADRLLFNSALQFKNQFYYESSGENNGQIKQNYIYTLNFYSNELSSLPEATNLTMKENHFELIKTSPLGNIYFDHSKKEFLRFTSGVNQQLLSVVNEKAYFSENEKLILLESYNPSLSEVNLLKIFIRN